MDTDRLSGDGLALPLVPITETSLHVGAMSCLLPVNGPQTRVVPYKIVCPMTCERQGSLDTVFHWRPMADLIEANCSTGHLLNSFVRIHLHCRLLRLFRDHV